MKVKVKCLFIEEFFLKTELSQDKRQLTKIFLAKKFSKAWGRDFEFLLVLKQLMWETLVCRELKCLGVKVKLTVHHFSLERYKDF